MTTVLSDNVISVLHGGAPGTMGEWDFNPDVPEDSVQLQPEVAQVLARIQTMPEQFVYAFNTYAYFTPCPAKTTSCAEWKALALCLDQPQCTHIKRLRTFRTVIEKQLGASPQARLWIGETGWTSPATTGLNTSQSAKTCWTDICEGWSDYSLFSTYYNNFLGWNLSIGEGVAPPDFVFYFTLRDAMQYTSSEHFGLMGGSMSNPWDFASACDNTTCKI
jgi:hypothetical protein